MYALFVFHILFYVKNNQSNTFKYIKMVKY